MENKNNKRSSSQSNGNNQKTSSFITPVIGMLCVLGIPTVSYLYATYTKKKDPKRWAINGLLAGAALFGFYMLCEVEYGPQ